MESSVWNPQMMTDVNCNPVNAELEVKKLKELVRKLERQNEQLRTRTNAVGSCAGSPHISQPSSACLLGSQAGSRPSPVFTGNYCVPSPVPTLLCSSVLGPNCTSEEPYAYFHPHTGADTEVEDVYDRLSEPTVLEEVEILDLESIFSYEEESEDTWLYVSPKARPGPESALSPLQWCRQVLDNPGAEVDAAKRSVSNRFELAHRWRGVFSRPALPISPLAWDPPSVPARPCHKPGLTERTVSFPSFCHSPPHPPPTPPLTPPLTQNEEEKNCPGLGERSPSFVPHSANHSYSHRRAPLSPGSSVDSELDGHSISMGYKLQDLTDVQIMARLQEESLRQDYASASISRRTSSFSLQTARPGGEDGEPKPEGEEESDQPSNRQPRLVRAGPLQRRLPHSHTFSSIRDCRHSPSVPQYLSSLSQQQCPSPASPSYVHEAPSPRASSALVGSPVWNQAEHENKLRRSMPNLLRAPSMPCVPTVPSVSAHANQAGSSPSIRSSQSFDSSHGLAKLQSSIPSQLQHRVYSVGNFPVSSRQPLKATAYVSPTVQGVAPTSSSSISPQSVSNRGIPLPNKSNTLSMHGGSALPRPTGAIPRSKSSPSVRSLLTPQKSLSMLSSLRERSWKDGCY